MQTSIGIILSGAYIASGMVSEFGRLPPAFLPLANKRLYCQQVAGLSKQVDNVVLTLPGDFEPEDFDYAWLRDHKVDIFPMKDAQTLGAAIADCLTRLPENVDDVFLLFGDTLLTNFDGFPQGSVAVGTAQEHSHWGYCRKDEDGFIEFYENSDARENNKNPIVIGCFRFERQKLSQSLALGGQDFYTALNVYSAKYGLTPVDTENGWYDFGHINAYFRSRQHFTTERSFNNLQMHNRKVVKHSRETLKMLAEIEWFENAPKDIGVYLPGYRGRTKHQGQIGYATEYLFLPLLSDLFMYSRLPEYVWRQIFNGCKEFMETCRAHKGSQEVALDSWWLYADKTQERLEAFSEQRGISLQRPWQYNGEPSPSLESIFAHALSLISSPTNDHISIIHGDFHLANIFFDFRSFGIKAIDPRGTVRGVPTIYGDYRYELAKLAHSVYGLYDFIMAGILKATVTENYDIKFVVPAHPSIKKIQNVFSSTYFNGLLPQSTEISAIVILLYLSMLPLHKDDRLRQDTLLANVFRLYSDMALTLPQFDMESLSVSPPGGAAIIA